jgi:hypothetical protein
MPVRRIFVSVAGILSITVACNDTGPAGPAQASCGANGAPVSLAAGAYASFDPAADSGCVTFAAKSSSDTAEWLVLPWSGGGNAGVHAPFALQSASSVVATTAAGRAPLFSTRGTNRRAVPIAFDRFLRQVGRTRQYLQLRGATGPQSSAPQPSATAGPPSVGGKRTFKVCSNSSCSSLASVGAVARSVGAHIAIYVDTLAPTPGLPTSDLDSLRDVFDTRLYPLDTMTFGHVSDIDTNTVVVVLMTNQVNKLVTKSQCNAGGYIVGFFWPGDLAPGFSQNYNNGEIFYSIVPDSLGTLSCAHKNSEVNNVMPVTFTHEFQHMINFVEHVLVRSTDGEEGWLDEGLSKYAEELAGRSFGDNAHFSQFAIGDVYDAYQYMLDPANTPLLIPADTGTLAMGGASWLFTRYIVDQFGDSLPGRLVRGTTVGLANVQQQTGVSSDTIIARWALANWVSDLPGFSAAPQLQYTSWHFRTTFNGLNSNDSTDFPLAYPLVPEISAPNGVNVIGTLWSGSGAYVRVMQPPGGAAFTLQFSDGSGSLVSAALLPQLNIIRIR